jgi:N-hydroxyarylamine O-acetyltransferase
MDDQMRRADITDGYIHELGLQRRKPDLTFLTDISSRHVAQFAFSSVGPRLGDDLPLDFESLYRRIVTAHRGGYCFEQNGLLFKLLQELGFSVSLYLARVIYNQDIHPGLTHRITLVEIDGERYIVDVGFGPQGPARPVGMSGKESNDGFRVFRIAQCRSGEFHMQTLQDGEFFSLYKFELAHYGQADCELGHFYSHKHPGANFVNHLVVSKIMDNEIRSLRNLEFTVISRSGEQKELIEDRDHLKRILAKQFDIRVTDAESSRLFA